MIFSISCLFNCHLLFFFLFAFEVILVTIITFSFHFFSQIYKEAAFGRLNYNISLLDGYTPSMFSNGVAHEKQKTFLLQICKIAQQSKIFETTLKLIKEYSTRWQNAGKVNLTFFRKNTISFITWDYEETKYSCCGSILPLVQRVSFLSFVSIYSNI